MKQLKNNHWKILVAIFVFHSSNSQEYFDYDGSYYYENNQTECTEDQLQCPGDDYGLSCIPIKDKCNGRFDCSDGFDESFCNNAIPDQVFVCDEGKNAVWARRVCPGNLECIRMCNGIPECTDGTDEQSIGIGFKCTSAINKADPTCLVPIQYIERWKMTDAELRDPGMTVCSDSQDMCYHTNSSALDTTKCFQCLDGTVIHNLQLCNGVVDCADLSDECMCEEREWMTENKNRGKMLTQMCEAQFKNKCAPNLIACNKGITTECILPTKLCDGKRDCLRGEDEEMCTQLKDSESQDRSTKAHEKRMCFDGETHATYCDGRPECIPMFEDECDCQGPLPAFCSVLNKSSIFILKGCTNLSPTQVCDGVYDCENGEDEDLCPHRRPCDPLDRSQHTYDVELDRCNLLKTCLNGADEANCSMETHFYCDDGTFISSEKVHDSHLDCPNAEDECIVDEKRLSYGQKMIGNTFLWVIMWLMCIVALAGNAVVIVQTARDLRYTLRRGATAAVSSRVGACNKILVFNLALADFLMGVYLFILNVKSLEYEGSYCRYDVAWRTSTQCQNLGILVVLSSQTSVIIMVMMTSYRLFTVRCPFRAEKLHFRGMSLVVAAAWIPAAIVAFVPLFSSNQVYAISLTSKHLFGKYVVEKGEIIRFISRAQQLRNSTEVLLPDHSWFSIETALCTMYPKVCDVQENNPLIQQRFGYYSQDSVCMPRLYPSVGDGGWELTAVIISFDFLSFIYILIAYLRIYRLTVIQEKGKNKHFWRSSSFSSVGEQQRAKEDKLIWHRITRLLVTDFICWTPICVIAFVALAGLNIPAILYQISAIVLLPINSALNPLLYSNAIPLACYSLASRLCPGKWKDVQTRSSFRKHRKSRQRFARENNNYRYNKNKFNNAVANVTASCSESNGNHVDRVMLNSLPRKGVDFAPEIAKEIILTNRSALNKQSRLGGNNKKLSVSTDAGIADNSTVPILLGRTSTSTCNSEVSNQSDRRHSFSLKPMRKILSRCFDTRSKSLRDTRVSDPFVDELPLFRRPKSQSSVSTATQCTALPTDTDTIY